jgi:hypothetical protein
MWSAATVKPECPPPSPTASRFCFGKLEIAVDLPHHVEEELVRRITAVHGAPDFGCGEASDIPALVVELAVGLFQPVLEGEAKLAAVRLIPCHVGDRPHAEERIDGPGRRTARRRRERIFPRCLELLCHLDLPLRGQG